MRTTSTSRARQPVPRCLRCHGRDGIDTELNLERTVIGDDGEGFLCAAERTCRARARAAGLPDLNFCKGCGAELVQQLHGKRPPRCEFCSKAHRIGLVPKCRRCDALISEAHLTWDMEAGVVCRAEDSCATRARRRRQPHLKLYAGGLAGSSR